MGCWYRRSKKRINLLREKILRLCNQPINPSMILEAGSKPTIIPFGEMAYWFSSDHIVILVLINGKKITTNFNALTTFADKLLVAIFFRLSRQSITHLQSIVSITYESNRILIVELSAVKSFNKSEKVTMSRYRSQQLKEWFADKVGR